MKGLERKSNMAQMEKEHQDEGPIRRVSSSKTIAVTFQPVHADHRPRSQYKAEMSDLSEITKS